MPTKPKQPKARVMILCDDEMFYPERAPAKYRSMIPCLVVQFPSRKSADSARKFWNLTEEQRVERLAEAIAKSGYKQAMADWVPGGIDLEPRKPNAADLKWYAIHARAVLAAMGGGRT